MNPMKKIDAIDHAGIYILSAVAPETIEVAKMATHVWKTIFKLCNDYRI
jgi:hypothetical protein